MKDSYVLLGCGGIAMFSSILAMGWGLRIHPSILFIWFAGGAGLVMVGIMKYREEREE